MLYWLKRPHYQAGEFKFPHCGTVPEPIVRESKQLNAAIAIEDLTGIRERTNRKPRNKTERRRSNSWAFFQLRQFLERI